VTLALEPPSRPIKATTIAARQGIPSRFLANILPHLCRAGIVGSRRGGEGGYWLARPASEITLAEIVRALEPHTGSKRRNPADDRGPVQGATDAVETSAEQESQTRTAGNLDVLRSSVQDGLVTVLESTTLLDVMD
jgi:Rrf2 family protein